MIESARIKQAAEALFPGQVDVLGLLAEASERVQKDILVLSYGDLDLFRHYANIAKLDFRDVVVCEERPEEFLDIPSRAQAARELADRFQRLGFDVPASIASWAS
jgi:hypothetical protein